MAPQGSNKRKNLNADCDNSEVIKKSRKHIGVENAKAEILNSLRMKRASKERLQSSKGKNVGYCDEKTGAKHADGNDEISKKTKKIKKESKKIKQMGNINKTKDEETCEKKDLAKIVSGGGTTLPISIEVQRNQSLEYLTTWKNYRHEWHFQKVRQVWLLRHMYDSNKVTDDDFRVLLEYMEGLKGSARKETVKIAEDLALRSDGEEPDDAEVESLVTGNENADKKTKASIKPLKKGVRQLSSNEYERVRQVLQLLT